jgi:predicted amidohydrolase
MRVACPVVAPVIGDLAGTAAKVAEAIDAADADVVVLPELALSGYAFDSLEEARAGAVSPDALDWSRPGKVVVGGFAERAGDGLFNSAALVDGDGVRAVYRKAHLWDREPSWFAAGTDEPPVVETEYGRVGVMVCFDLFFPEWVRVAALRGADLLCVPGNWPDEGREPPQVARAAAAAEANGIAVVLCDRHDEERGLRFAGATCIADASGRVVARGAGAVAEVAAGHRGPPAFRRPELYGRIGRAGV